MLALLLLAALFAACNADDSDADGQAPSLPADPVSVSDHYNLNFGQADEAKVAIARQALDYAHLHDYEALAAMYAPAAAVTAQRLSSTVGSIINGFGTFEGYTTLPPQQSEGTSADYGAVTGIMIECAYTDQFVLWQVLINAEDQVVSITTASTYVPENAGAAPAEESLPADSAA